MDITIPAIETRVSDYGFDIFCISPAGQLTLSGDFSSSIKAQFSRTLLDSISGSIDRILPFVVAYVANGEASIEVPSGENFFEQDFSQLNKIMFKIDTPDFLFE